MGFPPQWVFLVTNSVVGTKTSSATRTWEASARLASDMGLPMIAAIFVAVIAVQSVPISGVFLALPGGLREWED